MTRYVDEDGQVRYDLAESDFWFLLTVLARHAFEAGLNLPSIINDEAELWSSFWSSFAPLLEQLDPDLYESYLVDYPRDVDSNTHATA